jgi:DNA-binding CsgD family transcriptional regulator
MVWQALRVRSEPNALRGRWRERERLDQLLASVGARESRSLVVRGEAGVGKTALLEYVAAAAADQQVLRAIGVESEIELPFAALHQLCAPLLDELERLPAPQRDALNTAFGLHAGTVPDRFMVGLAVLSLLGEAAQDRPLICLVDDAQWLDRTSAQVLAFVARRLEAESIAFVFAEREASSILAGLPELVVEGLGLQDARALLEDALAGPLDPRVRDRIVAETRGNPLALLELPRGMTPAELAGGFGLPDATPIGDRIERSFQRRVAGMPRATRQLLLIAAAEPIGDPTRLWQAAARLQVDVVSALAGAEDLLAVDARVRFRHPLVRSAIYRVASPEDRREVHGALAESIPDGIDPDRRTWHRAHAAAGIDEEIAAELEASAGRAQARGGLAAAAAFLERAVQLTPEPGRRAQRALAAARAAHAAGAADSALALLQDAHAGPLDAREQAEHRLLEAQLAFSSRRGRDAAALLVAAARGLEPLDARLARVGYLEAIWAASFAGHLAHPSATSDVAAAVRAADSSAPRGPSEQLLDGLVARFVDGYRAGAPLLQRALRDVRRAEPDGLLDIAWVWLAVDLYDADAWFELGLRQVQAARDAGALTVLPLALHTLASRHVAAGELELAVTLLAEADSIMASTGNAPTSHGWLALAAMGCDDAQTLVDSAIRDGTERGEGVLVGLAEHAAATLHNGLGQHEEALVWARREVEHNPHAFYSTALGELVEAAAACGDDKLARRALKALVERTRPSGTGWALGVEARARALVCGGDAAESCFREAVALLDGSRMVVERARAQLLYGEWLERGGRRSDAREQLRAAHDSFSAMGAVAFADRAGRALHSGRESRRRRTVGPSDDLTDQQAQIARLARDGLTNAQIGGQLFISPRTVEYHLNKVFSKLGVTSRDQLGGVLADESNVA